MTNPFGEPRQLASVPDEPPVHVDPVPDPVDSSDPEPQWPHQTIVFKGDTLQVRKPTPQALAAFSLATSKYVSNEMRNNMTGMFIERHLSPESFERVFTRLMNPDDSGYTIDTIGELMRDVVTVDSDPAG